MKQFKIGLQVPLDRYSLAKKNVVLLSFRDVFQKLYLTSFYRLYHIVTAATNYLAQPIAYRESIYLYVENLSQVVNSSLHRQKMQNCDS